MLILELNDKSSKIKFIKNKHRRINRLTVNFLNKKNEKSLN